MLIFLLSLLSSVKPDALNETSNSSIVINVTVYGVVNESVNLPCTPPPENYLETSMGVSVGGSNLTLGIWKRSGNVITPSYRDVPRPSSDERRRAGANYTLHLEELQLRDAGVYECVAYETARQAYVYMVTLVVKGPPDPPKNVTAKAETETSVKVTWLPGSDNNSTILFYVVGVFTKSSGGSPRWQSVQAPQRSVLVSNLSPYTRYDVVVKAVNDVGRGEASQPVETRTLAGVPVVVPHIMDLNQTDRGVSLLVGIDGGLGDAIGLAGPLKGFRIIVWSEGGQVINKTVLVQDGEDRLLYREPKALTPFTTYSLSVSVFNGRFYGQKVVKQFTTEEGLPGETAIYQSTGRTAHSFTVWWQAVLNMNGVIDKYVLQLYHRGSRVVLRPVEVPASSPRRYTFKDLDPYTWYVVRIAASTKAGLGNFSHKYEVLTDIAPPPAPNLVLASERREGILFNWTKPAVAKSIKETIHYKLCWWIDPENTNVCILTQTKSRQLPAFCHCNQSAQYQWTFLPWSILNSKDKGTSKITVGMRAVMYSIYCEKINAECLKDGPLSNLWAVHLSDRAREYLRVSGKTNGVAEHPGLLAGLIVLIFFACAIGGGIIFVTWRMSCRHRGYLIARQTMDAQDLIRAMGGLSANGGILTLPRMRTFAQSRHPAIPITELPEHVLECHANDDAGFQAEFEAIEQSVRSDWPDSIARLPDSQPKNRYSNVLAYDHTRVVIQDLHDRKSNYINANYVDGYHRSDAYIATQGPLPSTFDDFWQMVWEQNSNIIVMISTLIERGRRKCDQYWPEEGSQTYGSITVKKVSQSRLAYCIIRVFAIHNVKACKKSCKERVLYHYQYTNWQDFDVPPSPLPVLMFIRTSVQHWADSCGPIVIHCSAGVGRTGTYICIESMIRQMEAEHQVNIRGFLEHIRQQRMKLVQTEQQYAFIHDALHEYLKCPEHVVSAEQLAVYARCLKVEEPCGCTRLQKQFQLCVEFEPHPHEYDESRKPCNITKNRSTICPVEKWRINLMGEPGVEGSNYINASRLQGYWNQNSFIVTQHPLETTEGDFWGMVWDENATLVVVLSSADLPDFWPSEGLEAREIGWLRVGYCGRDEDSEYEFLLSSVREDYALTTNLVRLPHWPTSPDDPEAATLLQLAHRMSSRTKGPIIVVDEFGSDRAAIFCALTLLMQHVENEGVLDVYFVFKMFHMQRPHIFHSHMNLEFVYDLMVQHLGERVDTPCTPMVNGWVPPDALSCPTRLALDLPPSPVAIETLGRVTVVPASPLGQPLVEES